jgi:hypothetical protein
MGNRIDANNLQVYYLEGVSKETAIEFATYWKNNDFVGDRKQVIQLDKDEDGYLLKLIERAIYHEETLEIDEQAKLQELERSLEDEVFDENVTIVITDNTFRPIERK